MKNKMLTCLLTMCFFMPPALAANQVFHYDPEAATIAGIIKIKKFPAPPKSENIGDKEEIYRYVILDQPIDVVPQKIDKNRPFELQKNVKEIQIVRIEDIFKNDDLECENYYRQNQIYKNKNPNSKCPYSNWSDKFVNERVEIKGTLYNHNRRVVMTAEHFKIIE